MPCWCAGKCPHIGKPQELLNQKQPHRARAVLRNSLTVAPLCVEGNLMMANILSTFNHAHVAMGHVDRAAPNADPGRIHFERGKVHRSAMKLDAAQQEFYLALQASPNNPNVAAQLVGSLEMAGLLKEAATVCEAARAKFPDFMDLRRLAATIQDAQGDTAGALETLAGSDLMPVELLDKGRFLEKAGRYDEAWAAWMDGKATLREKAGHIYDAPYWEKYFAALREASDPPRPNFVRRAAELETDPGPLFICGYPRSGTTMTESIFSSHSAVLAGDELMGITDVIESLPAFVKVRRPYPLAMMATSLGENLGIPNLLRDLYMQDAQMRIGFKERARGARPAKNRPLFFTDKMPLNELHLPLMRMLFPTAPIFRMQRHPLDVMVSCMANWLIHGGFYASSLESCARHYRSVYEIAKHHEKQMVVQDRRAFVTVRYEELVSSQEEKTTELLASAGLALEPGCIAFHKNKRTARTISYRQVKQPMNGIGVGRWKHFRQHLEPAVAILRPILDGEGYES
jgi:tetratricopeptide (TPR) repeat protein